MGGLDPAPAPSGAELLKGALRLPVCLFFQLWGRGRILGPWPDPAPPPPRALLAPISPPGREGWERTWPGPQI